MARAPVPSVDDFKRLCIKPEAFKGIPDEDILLTMSDVTDHVATAYAKHAKGIIKAWDGSARRAIVSITAYDLMSHRGYNKTSGADKQVEDRADKAEAFLDKIASGEREPFFADATSEADDGPLGGTSERSDDWTR